jgi:hypothetical protein
MFLFSFKFIVCIVIIWKQFLSLVSNIILIKRLKIIEFCKFFYDCFLFSQMFHEIFCIVFIFNIWEQFFIIDLRLCDFL